MPCHFRKDSGPRHKETATALVSLGVHRLQQEMYGEAEALLLRAIAIHEEIFGPDHPDVGMDSFHLASVYLYQLRYSEAEATLLRVMEIDSKTLPAGHPDRAYALRSLATVFQGQDRLPEAAELLERAIDIDVAALGAEHQRIQLNLALLGEVRAQMPEPEAAQAIYQRLVSWWKSRKLRYTQSRVQPPNLHRSSAELASRVRSSDCLLAPAPAQRLSALTPAGFVRSDVARPTEPLSH